MFPTTLYSLVSAQLLMRRYWAVALQRKLERGPVGSRIRGAVYEENDVGSGYRLLVSEDAQRFLLADVRTLSSPGCNG
jgi:hypothetical protein